MLELGCRQTMTGMETKRARGKCTANALVCQLCWTFLYQWSDTIGKYNIDSMTTQWSAYIKQREPAYSMTQTGWSTDLLEEEIYYISLHDMFYWWVKFNNLFVPEHKLVEVDSKKFTWPRHARLIWTQTLYGSLDKTTNKTTSALFCI